MNIAIVGATGLVGKMFLEVLEERNFLHNKIYLLHQNHLLESKLNLIIKIT